MLSPTISVEKYTAYLHAHVEGDVRERLLAARIVADIASYGQSEQVPLAVVGEHTRVA